MARLEKNRSRKATIESQRASGARGTNSLRRAFFTAAIRDERGQAIIWTALALLLLLGASAFAIDIGHAMLVRKQLQASADAAALAAAWHISDGTYTAVADKYSSTGTLNNYGGYSVDTPVVTVKCSSTVASFGPHCSTTTTPPTYDMVIVQETAHVNTFFAGVMGFHTLTVSATSAASKGARPTPFNVAIVLDTTYSMTYNDADCGMTQLKCAEGAIAELLSNLDPAVDKVSIFTFPALNASTEGNQTHCPSSAPTTEPYTFPSASATTLQTPTLSGGVTSTYEIAGFDNSYLSSYGASSLTSTDPLVIAVGKGGCTGIVADAATHFTYFAASIYQAHEALLVEQATEASAGLQTSNAMIIFSDGNSSAINDGPSGNPPGQPNNWHDMACNTGGGAACPSQTVTTGGVSDSSDGTYPNLVGQCNQAVAAAKSFNNFVVNPDGTSTGTLVFSVAYGASTLSQARSGMSEGDCDSDRAAYTPPYTGTGTVGITPCQTMEEMSTGWPDPSNFFSDYKVTGGDTGCQTTSADQSNTSLTGIVDAILSKLSESRLIPPDAP